MLITIEKNMFFTRIRQLLPIKKTETSIVIILMGACFNNFNVLKYLTLLEAYDKISGWFIEHLKISFYAEIYLIVEISSHIAIMFPPYLTCLSFLQ